MPVYADVLVVVNFVVNLFILMAVGKIAGAITTRKRLWIGAFIGAISSLIIFIPLPGFFLQFLYKILVAAAMTAAAFGCKPYKKFAGRLFVTFAVSFIFAGLMLAVWFLFSPAGMLFYNGIVYFHISALTLILTTTAAYLIVTLIERLFFSRISEKQLYDITIVVNGKALSTKALADTGSNLKEPFSGAPVVICDRMLAQKITPQEKEKFRVIPCLTVTGEGLLEGFRPDYIEIAGENINIKTSDVYIAISREKIVGEYQALLNPQILKLGATG